jgi:hypothetical protein
LINKLIDKSVHQAGFADAGFAHDHKYLAPTTTCGGQPLMQPVKFSLAIDQGGVGRGRRSVARHVGWGIALVNERDRRDKAVASFMNRSDKAWGSRRFSQDFTQLHDGRCQHALRDNGIRPHGI